MMRRPNNQELKKLIEKIKGLFIDNSKLLGEKNKIKQIGYSPSFFPRYPLLKQLRIEIAYAAKL